jgi:hypothetical protein
MFTTSLTQNQHIMKTMLQLLLRPMVLRTLGIALLAFACSEPDVVPSKTPSGGPQNISEEQDGNSSEFGRHWGRDADKYNLDVILLGPGKGFGYIKFRQHKNETQMIYLDTWVVGLQPNTSYQLQRAVDTDLDASCTGTSWLTLGKGLVPQSIVTNNWVLELQNCFAVWQQFSRLYVRYSFKTKENTEAVLHSSSCYGYT